MPRRAILPFMKRIMLTTALICAPLIGAAQDSDEDGLSLMERGARVSQDTGQQDEGEADDPDVPHRAVGRFSVVPPGHENRTQQTYQQLHAPPTQQPQAEPAERLSPAVVRLLCIAVSGRRPHRGPAEAARSGRSWEPRLLRPFLLKPLIGGLLKPLERLFAALRNSRPFRYRSRSRGCFAPLAASAERQQAGR